MSALADWVLLAALHFAPLETRPQFPGHEETREEAFGRYLGIAADIAHAAEERGGTEQQQRRNAALLLAVAIGESGLARDVDAGKCHRAGGWRERCDAGTSWTIWQLKTGIVDGQAVSGAKLAGFERRRDAARAALRALLGSMGKCRALPMRDRLSMYGSGRCVGGIASVRARWSTFERVLAFRG